MASNTNNQGRYLAPSGREHAPVNSSKTNKVGGVHSGGQLVSGSKKNLAAGTRKPPKKMS